jgi:selenocysteine-specific elongation factor
VQSGRAVELSPEVVLLADSLALATGVVRDFLRTQGSASASEVRQALSASRRIVIPLLEHLDRTGVTRREGDQRVLKKP